MIFFWRRRTGDLIKRGDEAMARRDWAIAASAYAAIVQILPKKGAFHVQRGHALKELGDISGAELSYRRAMEIMPDDIDAVLHYARVLKMQGQVKEAMDCFADILRREPGCRAAYAELVHGGARHLIPANLPRSGHIMGLSVVEAALQTVGATIADWHDVSVYPVTSYDSYRQDFQIKRPPSGPPMPPIDVVIDARQASPSFLRSTLLSLVDQVDAEWRAWVITTAELAAHSVAGIAVIDDRVRFITESRAFTGSDYELHLAAGTRLDPYSLQWFAFAVARTGCLAAWCDHDYSVENWRDRPRYENPQLWGVRDRYLLAQAVNPPAAVLVHTSILAGLSQDGDAECRRALLLRAAARHSTTHIPQILASVLRVPEQAVAAPVGHDFPHIWSADPRGSPPVAGPMPELGLTIVERGQRPAVAIVPVVRPEERIQIVIQTRDEGRMLEAAVSTLLKNAHRPDRIDITIVDNRSTEPETARSFSRLSRQSGVEILTLDEPFNWSRANNVAAARSGTDHILFANNDIEMLTSGWDDILLGFLQSEDIGVVGVRLLYPDGKLQHAAMVFGTGEGTPVHEGVHSDGNSAGPQDRYDLTHLAAAVTGAFMAVRRDMFEQVGGFDSLALPIGYNDIDMCLRIRSAGRHVLYTPAIELTHYESKTRGINDTRARVAWDQGELAAVYGRWGGALTYDPGYSPHWSQRRAYESFRRPALREIIAHMDLSATENPWKIPGTYSDDKSKTRNVSKYYQNEPEIGTE